MSTLDFIKNIKNRIQKCEHYSDESFEIKNNKGYDSIWLCKSAVLKIKEAKNKINIKIAKRYLEKFNISDEVRFTKSEPEWGKAVLNENIIKKLVENIEDVFEQCYLDQPVESFGCCSRYIECSDNKKCTHPDLDFARGCIYKKNLEDGRIFYGKNRNVD